MPDKFLGVCLPECPVARVFLFLVFCMSAFFWVFGTIATLGCLLYTSFVYGIFKAGQKEPISAAKSVLPEIVLIDPPDNMEVTLEVGLILAIRHSSSSWYITNYPTFLTYTSVEQKEAEQTFRLTARADYSFAGIITMSSGDKQKIINVKVRLPLREKILERLKTENAFEVRFCCDECAEKFRREIGHLSNPRIPNVIFHHTETQPDGKWRKVTDSIAFGISETAIDEFLFRKRISK